MHIFVQNYVDCQPTLYRNTLNYRSSSQQWISVRTKLKDAATLSWMGLVKQGLPNRDSCWLASANVAVASSSPSEGKTVLQTTALPRISSNNSNKAATYIEQWQQQKQQQQRIKGHIL